MIVVLVQIMSRAKPGRHSGRHATSPELAPRLTSSCLGRGDDTVGNAHRAQICQFEMFELILLLKVDTVPRRAVRGNGISVNSTLPHPRNVSPQRCPPACSCSHTPWWCASTSWWPSKVRGAGGASNIVFAKWKVLGGLKSLVVCFRQLTAEQSARRPILKTSVVVISKNICSRFGVKASSSASVRGCCLLSGSRWGSVARPMSSILGKCEAPDGPRRAEGCRRGMRARGSRPPSTSSPKLYYAIIWCTIVTCRVPWCY